MSKQPIGVGTNANDNTGDPIRNAFIKVNSNEDELYEGANITATAPLAKATVADTSVTLSLSDAGVTFAKIQNVAANSLLVRDANSSGVLTAKALATTQILIGDGTGMTAAALSGDATMTNAGVVSIGAGKVITDKILDNNVTISKMANDSVGADELVDNSVGAAALNVSGNGSDGNILKSDGDGSFSWIANDQGDITGVAAGAGLTGGGTAGDVTLTVGAGTGITVGADAISLTAGGITATQLGGNSVTPAKVSIFDDNAAATDTHILVADGTDFINKAVSGDATLANTGALTIAADAVTYAKMQNLGTANRLLGSTSTGVIGETQVVAAMMAANSVNSDSYVDGSIDTVHVANDQITHDKLENRYTAAVTISTLTGAYTLDWSTGAVFVMSGTLSGNIEFDFTNFKAGQTIDIYNLTGAYTITFDSNAGTSETFNKCGAVDYVAASTNLIQIQCVDDDATAVFNYAVSAYVSDATPS